MPVGLQPSPTHLQHHTPSRTPQRWKGPTDQQQLRIARGKAGASKMAAGGPASRGGWGGSGRTRQRQGGFVLPLCQVGLTRYRVPIYALSLSGGNRELEGSGIPQSYPERLMQYGAAAPCGTGLLGGVLCVIRCPDSAALVTFRETTGAISAIFSNCNTFAV